MMFLLALACTKGDVDDTADSNAVALTDLALTFDARFGSEGAACGTDYEGIGTAQTTVEIEDLRFYVHDVVLADADGNTTPLVLTADGVFQNDAVALLDFEDASAACDNGNAPTNDQVVGGYDADAIGSVAAVSFKVGIPFEHNHADPSAADSPLNLTSMHWNWQGGYKFLRLDLDTGVEGGWFIHLGSTDCHADEDGNVTSCDNPNRPQIDLDMTPDQTIVLDLAALLADSDVSKDEGVAQGCMSGPTDPECPAILGAFGLVDAEQVVFTAE